MSISMETRRCIRPLIIFNSIFATGLLEYYNDKSTNIIGYSYAFFTMVFYIICFSIIMYVLKSYTKNRPFIMQMTFHAHTYSHLFFFVYTIMFGFFRIKEMKCLLTQAENCTRSMEELGIPRNYPKYNRYLWYVMLAMSTILIMMGLIDFIWSYIADDDQELSEIILLFIIEHYPFIVLSTGEVSFIFWILCIKLKFGELNALLRDMLTTTIDSPQHKRVLRMKNNRKDDSPSRDIHQAYQMDKDIKKIKKIKQIHLELIKCARITNTAYGWHILMSMTTSFILLTTLFYNVYNFLFERFYEAKLDFFGFVYWISYFVIKIIVTTHVCSITMVEGAIEGFLIYYFSLHAAKTGDIICELYEPSKSKEYRTEIREFTQQIIQNPLTFTACGFFNLDHTYIRSVIGSVTTYLVILIQVGNAPLKFYVGNGSLPGGNI